jgi:hypothetical protein
MVCVGKSGVDAGRSRKSEIGWLDCGLQSVQGSEGVALGSRAERVEGQRLMGLGTYSVAVLVAQYFDCVEQAPIL